VTKPIKTISYQMANDMLICTSKL